MFWAALQSWLRSTRACGAGPVHMVNTDWTAGGVWGQSVSGEPGPGTALSRGDTIDRAKTSGPRTGDRALALWAMSLAMERNVFLEILTQCTCIHAIAVHLACAHTSCSFPSTLSQGQQPRCPMPWPSPEVVRCRPATDCLHIHTPVRMHAHMLHSLVVQRKKKEDGKGKAKTHRERSSAEDPPLNTCMDSTGLAQRHPDSHHHHHLKEPTSRLNCLRTDSCPPHNTSRLPPLVLSLSEQALQYQLMSNTGPNPAIVGSHKHHL